MRIAVSRFETAQISRIAQLFLRSNQFNLTTVRHDETDCTAMMLDHDGCVPLTASLRDRFGEYGLISIVVAKPEGETLRITDWLMSCRVLGRGVEQYLMNMIVAIAKERGLSKITGQYIPTSKNGMVKDFWAQFGFESADGRHWTLLSSNYQQQITYIHEESVANQMGAVA
jgi:FkbH-like protein